jgi:hypothetical protein
MIEPLDVASTPAFCCLIPGRLAIPNLLMVCFKTPSPFLCPSLFFPALGLCSTQKKAAASKNNQNIVIF